MALKIGIGPLFVLCLLCKCGRTKAQRQRTYQRAASSGRFVRQASGSGARFVRQASSGRSALHARSNCTADIGAYIVSLTD